MWLSSVHRPSVARVGVGAVSRVCGAHLTTWLGTLPSLQKDGLGKTVWVRCWPTLLPTCKTVWVKSLYKRLRSFRRSTLDAVGFSPEGGRAVKQQNKPKNWRSIRRFRHNTNEAGRPPPRFYAETARRCERDIRLENKTGLQTAPRSPGPCKHTAPRSVRRPHLPRAPRRKTMPLLSLRAPLRDTAASPLCAVRWRLVVWPTRRLALIRTGVLYAFLICDWSLSCPRRVRIDVRGHFYAVSAFDEPERHGMWGATDFSLGVVLRCPDYSQVLGSPTRYQEWRSD